MEARSGTPIFTGETHQFEDWNLCLLAKMLTSTDEQKKVFAVHAVGGLRGCALRVPRKVGMGRFLKDDGPEHFNAVIQAEILRLATVETCELFALGAKSGSLLARAYGEPMCECTSRREPWHRKLTGPDESLTISDDIRSQLLLDNATLEKPIMASIANSMNFEKIAACLQPWPGDAFNLARQRPYRILRRRR